MDITIRQALLIDRAHIAKLNKSAAKNKDKKNLIKELQKTRDYVKELFLVAEVNKKIVGHLMFYPVYIVSRHTKYKTLSLIEMTLHPDYENEGVGERLIEEGIKCSKTMGFFSIVILNASEYYAQFGFKAASRYQIRQPSSSPNTSFMALELVPGALNDIPGKVEYPEAYHKAS
ncbi:MAG: N-acetyltransferase [Elusimicrobia bacterium]|nr:N-acetyltransferase [Elusimicrobiota bacterium]